MGKLIRKTIKTIEIEGTGEVELSTRQKVINVHFLFENTPEPKKDGIFPRHKTIVVLEELEFDDSEDDAHARNERFDKMRREIGGGTSSNA